MVELAVYRIVQEALTNVARHAQTAAAEVRVVAAPGRLSILVEDHGRGFDPDTLDPYRSSGLSGIAERVRLLGGALTVTAAPSQDVSVFAGLTLQDTRPSDLPYAPRTSVSMGTNWQALPIREVTLEKDQVLVRSDSGLTAFTGCIDNIIDLPLFQEIPDVGLGLTETAHHVDWNAVFPQDLSRSDGSMDFKS